MHYRVALCVVTWIPLNSGPCPTPELGCLVAVPYFYIVSVFLPLCSVKGSFSESPNHPPPFRLLSLFHLLLPHHIITK